MVCRDSTLVLFDTTWRSGNNRNVGSSALVVSRWLGPGNRTFLEVASMVVTWWIVAFCAVNLVMGCLL